jgi:hypothetical protein
MIERTLRSDDEAELYSLAFFHQNRDLPAPEIIRSSSLSRTQSSSHLSKVVCFRCGELGHMRFSCTKELDSCEDLEKEVNDDIERVIERKRNCGNIRSDEFGLWFSGFEGSVPTELSWRTTVFCTNCGCGGHRERDCKHRPFSQIAYRMRECLQPKSGYSGADIKSFFEDLWG